MPPPINRRGLLVLYKERFWHKKRKTERCGRGAAKSVVIGVKGGIP